MKTHTSRSSPCVYLRVLIRARSTRPLITAKTRSKQLRLPLSQPSPVVHLLGHKRANNSRMKEAITVPKSPKSSSLASFNSSARHRPFSSKSSTIIKRRQRGAAVAPRPKKLNVASGTTPIKVKSLVRRKAATSARRSHRRTIGTRPWKVY